MFASIRRRRHHQMDIWPGFVDALSALLMVIIFVLMTFVLSQMYLSYALSTREEALETQNSRIRELLQKLQAIQSIKEKVETEFKGLQLSSNKLQTDHDLLKDEKASLENQLLTTSETLTQEQEALAKQRQENTSLTESLAQRTTEIKLLHEEVSKFKIGAEKSKIEIDKLKEKERHANSGFSQFRSEFLAKLQKIVGDRSDIRIVGDRFVFQSELFFEIGSAELGVEGKKQLDLLSKTLKEIASKIPSEISWVLRVDGHTDRRPIKDKFPSNWELSTARALSVVRYLISQGISPEHLVAAGFGEFQPLVKGTTDEKELARNRRIELKLDQR